MANKELAAYKAGLKTKGRNGKRNKNGIRIPLAVVAGFVPLGISMWNVRDQGGSKIMSTLSKRLTGYDPETAKWSLGDMKCGTFAILGGLLVHWLAGKVGVNRAIARAGIPIIRI